MPGSKTRKLKPTYTQNVEELVEAEKQHLQREQSLIGLAISGGGIRSASFGLGVMQRLVKERIMPRIDYLSTVSGGGYIGSALTWFLHKGLPGGGKAGTEPENFPLGQIGAGGRTDRSGNEVLDYIRQHGNYLTPGSGLSPVSLFGVVLRSMFASLFVYLAIFTVVMVLLRWSRLLDTGFLRDLFGVNLDLNFLMALALAIIAVLILTSLVFSLGTRLIVGSGEKRYKRLIRSQKALGMAWTLAFASLFVGSMPYVAGWLGTLLNKIAAAGLSTALGALSGFLQRLKSQKPQASKGGAMSNTVILIGALALVYGLLLSAFVLADFFTGGDFVVVIVRFLVLVAVAAGFGWLVNLNYVGFHRMYRDRLMETFMPNAENAIKNEWGPATHADGALLEQMCGGENRRPYHLINTNIILGSSPASKFRSRGGDNFILSPLYCGSDATGWRSTNSFMKPGCRGMTLATAMAISGAAVNPGAGVAGKGLTRSRLPAMLMGILNIRLGYWASNPSREKPWSAPPNFIVPGLTSDVLGLGLHEHARAIELTDGGHFENLGIYELIRRKLKIIILSDGTADPAYHFGDLANAVERVRVDFGAKIRFREQYDLDGLLPDSEPEKDEMAKKYRFARRGFAIADITYQDGSTGILLYVSTTLTKGLPADVYGYKATNPDFPDQSTGDQFFDEEQFEAYRELGYQLAKQMLACEEARKALAM